MRKGRFKKKASPLLQEYSQSISFDKRLYKEDIRGSIAHANALRKADIITKDELSIIKKTLKAIKNEIANDSFPYSIELEDIHMHIENALIKKIGKTGAKLHTARSRNDQIATDTRLYCRKEIVNIQNLIAEFQSALCQQAELHIASPMPGYTHLQRGQPITLAHHFLAFVEMLERDHSRLQDCLKRLNSCPLGSGALAGSSIILDRKNIADELNFDSITKNSLDAVSDRDYIAELCFVVALCGIHISRLAEDIILWSSSEFNFIELNAIHSTGSSLMPQKKNPDSFELARGKSSRLVGNLISILTLLKAQAMSYNRDLQEDKEPLFNSIDIIKLSLKICASAITLMRINSKEMLKAASDPMLFATDIADYLVKKGLAFRDAHRVVGELSAYCQKEKTDFTKLKLSFYKKKSELFEADIFELLDPVKLIKKRNNIGSPSPLRNKERINHWQNLLAKRLPNKSENI